VSDKSPIGVCRLCRKEAALRKSHFIPAAFYRPKGQEYTTRKQSGVTDMEVKIRLLCGDCEVLFNDSGESEVIKWIAPKAKQFPLYERIKLAIPILTLQNPDHYSGTTLGVNMDRFGYFALSVLWRSAVVEWPLPDGTMSSVIELGEHEELIRTFLLGESAFPVDTTVGVLVCTDQASREAWFTPSKIVDEAYVGMNVVGFLLRGVLFRIFMGKTVPRDFHDRHCCSTALKSIFKGDHSKKTLWAYSFLKGPPKMETK
jgi:hypothetical protein